MSHLETKDGWKWNDMLLIYCRPIIVYNIPNTFQFQILGSIIVKKDETRTTSLNTPVEATTEARTPCHKKHVLLRKVI
jgi:hypothetical protein